MQIRSTSYTHTLHIFTQDVFKAPVGIKIDASSSLDCQGERKDANHEIKLSGAKRETSEVILEIGQKNQCIQEVISTDMIIFSGKAVHLASQSSINQ